MSLIISIVSKFRALVFRKKLDAEMAEEMQAHMAMQEELNRSSGMSADDARFAARRQFGHLDGIQEQARDGRGLTWLLDLVGDVRFAGRLLIKSPGFALTVILTLAFGIATNTQIFALINMFYLRPLPVKDPSNLVFIAQRSTAFNMPHGIPFEDFRDYRSRLTSVRDLIAFCPRPVNFSSPGKMSERSWAEFVTPDAFAIHGVSAQAGRTLLPSDGEYKGALPVAVVTHHFWKNRLGSENDVVGRNIMVNGKPFTIVGVLAEGFNGFGFGLQMDMLLPSGTAAQVFADGEMTLANRSIPMWKALGRIAPGATLDQARAELATASQVLMKDYPVEHQGTSTMMVPERRARPDVTISDLTPMIAVVFSGMVALVLFIACANVANLMLARAITRQREFALRSAIGASRFRLIRQMLVESLFLAAFAGLIAVLLNEPMGHLMQKMSPPGDVPAQTNYAADWRHLLFVPAISLATGILAGLLPALKGSRSDILTTIKQGSANATPGEKHRMRNMLVIGQVAMSLVILVGAGLFARSLRSAQAVSLGFNSERLISLSIDLDLQAYEKGQGLNFQRDLLQRVNGLPEVESAALVQHIPFGYASSFAGIWPEVPPSHLKDGTFSAAMTRVSHSYFETMGISLLKGRLFGPGDRNDTTLVGVVNELFAQISWPGQDPIGKRFRMWNTTGAWVEVIGVVPTGRYQMVGESPRPFCYLSSEQEYAGMFSLVVRAKRDPAPLAATLRGVVTSLDPLLPVYAVRTMEEHLRGSVFGFMPLRMGAFLAGFQGAMGLFLAVMGLYAVVSYGVTQRTREIGVRMALGATRDSVTRLVVREGLRLTLIGLGLGSVFAVALGFALSKVLYALPAFDLLVFMIVVLLLLGTTLLACWLPARRAATISPMQALRAE